MALITKISEINAIYPTSKWDKIDALTAPLEKVERTRLVRLLGQQLFDQVVTDYKSSLIPKPEPKSDITQQTDVVPVEPTASDAFKFDVIRTCQEIELYIMLSNNVRILTSSLNRGGGFNMMTADNYETPDEKQMDALKRETWRNAMDSVEHLLLLLEQDAEGDRVYSELWQKSRYYYQHCDLLFTTAVDLQRYLNIDESRDRFIQLLPTIRNCQDVYIATRIGAAMLNDLVASQVPGASTSVSAAADSSFGVVRNLVKQSLAQYVASETKELSTDTSHLNADRLIGLAVQQVLSNADTYSAYITKGSPLAFEYQQQNGEAYLTPEERETLAEATAKLAAGSVTSTSKASCEQQEYDALCDLGGLHLM